MKVLLLSLLLSVSIVVAKAQDTIITTTNDTIECRIISVGEERINYEQIISGNNIVGKSIDISEVYKYVRSEQSGRGMFDQYKLIRQMPEHRFLITVQGGLARSFIDRSDFKNMLLNSGVAASKVDNYTRKLKNGYHLSAGVHYLLTASIGLGADYSLFYSTSEANFLIRGYGDMNVPVYVNADLKEDLYNQFAGPSVLFQQFTGKKKNIRITETIAPGVVIFRNEERGTEYQIYWGDNDSYSGTPPQYYSNSNVLVTSTAFGAKAGVSLEYLITPQLSAGLAGNFIWAKLQKVSLKGLNQEMENQELENAMNISHLAYGFTLRYNF